jgi:hypothetical protein
VKFRENAHGDGRGIFNEQVVALAARLIGAPVPHVELVDVAQALVDGLVPPSVSLNYVPTAGTHHGSRWVGANVSDRAGVQQVDVNRTRFAALEVLHAWIPCIGDHQWIYSNDPPYEVYSVDHNAFFPGGESWNEAGLLAGVGNVALDVTLAGLGLTAADRAAAADRLRAVSAEDIAAVVARPPDEWGIPLHERIAVASYLHARREPTIALFSA